MSDNKDNKYSYSLTNEASYGVTSESWSDYTAARIKRTEDSGTTEFGVAYKETDNSRGVFIEGKYTSPKLNETNWSLESRTRIHGDFSKDEETHSSSLTQRIAAKGSWKLDDNLSIYEIAGASTSISLDKGSVKTLTPLSLTGISYNYKNGSIYLEGEVSKSYKVPTKNWNNVSLAVYAGIKISF